MFLIPLLTSREHTASGNKRSSKDLLNNQVKLSVHLEILLKIFLRLLDNNQKAFTGA